MAATNDTIFLEYKHVKTKRSPESVQEAVLDLRNSNSYLDIFLNLVFKNGSKDNGEIFNNIANEVKISPKWSSRCSLGLSIIELGFEHSQISHYYIKNGDLTRPYHNFPFHEMPLMSIYSSIFHAIHSKDVNALRNISLLIDDGFIIHWLLDGIMNARVMFRNIFDIEENYAALVALIRDYEAMKTFHIYTKAIFHTVVTGIPDKIYKSKVIKLLRLKSKNLFNYEYDSEYIMKQIEVLSKASRGSTFDLVLEEKDNYPVYTNNLLFIQSMAFQFIASKPTFAHSEFKTSQPSQEPTEPPPEVVPEVVPEPIIQSKKKTKKTDKRKKHRQLIFNEYTEVANKVFDDLLHSNIKEIGIDLISSIILDELIDFDYKDIALDAIEIEKDRVSQLSFEYIITDISKDTISNIYEELIIEDVINKIVDNVIKEHNFNIVSEILDTILESILNDIFVEKPAKTLKEMTVVISKFAKTNLLPVITKRFFNLNFENCIAILHGGYAVERYNSDYQTSDIDIKLIPKGNVTADALLENFMHFASYHITYAPYIREIMNNAKFFNSMKTNPLLNELRQELGNGGEQIKSIDVFTKHNKDFVMLKISLQYYPYDGIPTMIPLFDLTFWRTNNVQFHNLNQIDKNLYIYNCKFMLHEKKELVKLNIAYKNSNWLSQIKCLEELN